MGNCRCPGMAGRLAASGASLVDELAAENSASEHGFADAIDRHGDVEPDFLGDGGLPQEHSEPVDRGGSGPGGEGEQLRLARVVDGVHHGLAGAEPLFPDV